MTPARWQIGSLSVRFTGDLAIFGPLLGRPPGADGEHPVTVSVTLCNAVSWPIGIDASPTHHRKGLPTHQTVVDFSTNTIDFQVVSPCDATALYLIHRDLFCGLGGLAGEPLLHASAVVHDGQTHVFLAESGGGKSTIARLLQPHAAWLNDEIIWITMSNGRPAVINQAYWRGEDSCGLEPLLPLRAAYLIRKAPKCELRDAAPSELFAMALGAPFDNVDPYLPNRAAKTAGFLPQIRCCELDVPLDGAAVASVIFGTSSSP